LRAAKPPRRDEVEAYLETVKQAQKKIEKKTKS